MKGGQTVERYRGKTYLLRPSCYHCRLKKLASGADLTLGDFWGIWKEVPEMDDNRGTSMVLVQTPKGAELFRGIEDDTVCKQMHFALVPAFNSAYDKSTVRTEERDRFFTDLDTIPFGEMIKKYGALSAKEELKRTARYKVIKKILP